MIRSGDDEKSVEPLLVGIEGETEEEFAQEVAELVAEDAPRLFALVQEYGERADARVIAWGMAFDEYAEAVSVGRGRHGTFPSAERARQAFFRRAKVRLVWTDAETTPRSDDDPAARQEPVRQPEA